MLRHVSTATSSNTPPIGSGTHTHYLSLSLGTQLISWQRCAEPSVWVRSTAKQSVGDWKGDAASLKRAGDVEWRCLLWKTFAKLGEISCVAAWLALTGPMSDVWLWSGPFFSHVSEETEK